MKEISVKWQYSETEQHEGNECLITKVSTIMEVDDSYFIATCSTIYKGWFGVDCKTQSCVFTNYVESRDYCEKYFREN